ncbi:MAG: isoprenylcysteine carboxylmethyltransferase family protein [Clostridia bacterium]|nr:isoprenylcysteine carboxylmethyltransferase family protein [Clostridia bacterium]
MSVKLFIQAIVKFVFGILLVGLLIFLPAGTLLYWQGLLLMGILFVPMLIAGIVMMFKNPELLKKRLDAKEKESTQKWVLLFSGIIFIGGFVLAGLGHRFGWYTLPTPVTVIGVILFLVAYILYAEVLRENTYLSRTVEVQENQTVIDTGLYGLVRHPMYAATVLLFLMIPIVLGSLYAFFVFLPYPLVLAMRIKNEEEVLSRELAGYPEYKQKVKYRMIPFIW